MNHITVFPSNVPTGSPDCQPGYDFYSRNFAPWVGVPEDPVTGETIIIITASIREDDKTINEGELFHHAGMGIIEGQSQFFHSSRQYKCVLLNVFSCSGRFGPHGAGKLLVKRTWKKEDAGYVIYLEKNTFKKDM